MTSNMKMTMRVTLLQEEQSFIPYNLLQNISIRSCIRTKSYQKAITDYYTDTNTTSAPREVRYTVVPNPLTADADDDFGFERLLQSLQITRNVILLVVLTRHLIMSNPFDGLNDAFGTEPTELQKHVEKVKPTSEKQRLKM
ncbi:MAG: hypothetical protein CM15mV28_0590 [Thaumasvirus sp.]|nr:MAG: hypothetical protein CM15mV28_0590 [Thaumasvirus sp.]